MFQVYRKVIQFYIFMCIYICIREGNGAPLQYSCLENPMDGGAWPGNKESDTTEATEHARMHGIRTQ